LDAPHQYHNKEKAKGLKTLDNNKYYLLTADMGKSFSNENKTLIISYTVLYPQRPDCAGAYIKILPEVVNQEKFLPSDPYYVMFGPDRCGHARNDIQFIIQKKQKPFPIKKHINTTADEGTRIFTLMLHFQNYSYEIFVDEDRKYDGKLWEDFDFMEPPMVFSSVPLSSHHSSFSALFPSL
jgi:calreticulin